MKNRILSALILALVTISTAFATDDNLNQKVLNTFSQKFNNASQVHWIKSDGYYKATFTWNDQSMFAYINDDGEIIGIARNLISFQLPINLQTSLKKEFANSWITELYEFSSENSTDYYVTLENADQTVTLRNYGSSSWTVFKKVKK